MSFCVFKLHIYFGGLVKFEIFLNMANNLVEWFQNKLIDLEGSDNKKEILLELKAFVLKSDKKVLNSVSTKVSLNPLFDCTESSDSQEVEQASTILLNLLSDTNGEKLLQVYGTHIQRSLANNTTKVVDTSLKLLNKSLNDNSMEILFKYHEDIILNVAKCLGSNESSIAEGAKLFFVKIRNTPNGPSRLFSPAVVHSMKEVIAKNDVAKIRVYENYIAASVMSPEYLEKSITCGMMESVTGELSSKDILMQLNALEMLSNLTNCAHGLKYLQEKNIIQNLIDKLAKLNKDPSSSAFTHLLLPGLIEFIGNLVTQIPGYFIPKHPEILDSFLNSLESNDDVLLGVVISSISKIGSHPEGRIELNKFNNKTLQIIKKIGSLLKTKNDLTLSVLNSLSELMKCIKSNSDSNLIAKHWFDAINPSAMDSTIALTKLPFVEFRFGAFTLLRAVATQVWGVEVICNYAGLIEFLTDRSNEFNKECKQIKYEIVSLIVQCSSIESIVSEQLLSNLKQFVKDGPFYVPAKVEMATEGAV